MKLLSRFKLEQLARCNDHRKPLAHIAVIPANFTPDDIRHVVSGETDMLLDATDPINAIAFAADGFGLVAVPCNYHFYASGNTTDYEADYTPEGYNAETGPPLIALSSTALTLARRFQRSRTYLSFQVTERTLKMDEYTTIKRDEYAAVMPPWPVDPIQVLSSAVREYVSAQAEPGNAFNALHFDNVLLDRTCKAMGLDGSSNSVLLSGSRNPNAPILIRRGNAAANAHLMKLCYTDPARGLMEANLPLPPFGIFMPMVKIRGAGADALEGSTLSFQPRPVSAD